MYFTQIPEFVLHNRSIISSKCQGKLSTYLSDVVDYVLHNYRPSLKYKKQVLDYINTIIYFCVSDSCFPLGWSSKCPFDRLDVSNVSSYKKILGDAYLEMCDIEWDIDYDSANISNSVDSISANVSLQSKLDYSSKADNSSYIQNNLPDMKELRKQISFELPMYPSIDTTCIHEFGQDEAGRKVPIFSTLPKIPVVQNDISSTTDINNLSDDDLLKLFPPVYIPRIDDFYSYSYSDCHDPVFGYVPCIEGFSKQQVIDNIIQYPQFNYLYRCIDNRRISFFKRIEIDGKLYSIDEAMLLDNCLKHLPQNKFIIKDYIIRKYLLERDIKHVDHISKLFGTFTPFLTLIGPPKFYIDHGYTDILQIAKQCVAGRVQFYRSRNPLLKGVEI